MFQQTDGFGIRADSTTAEHRHVLSKRGEVNDFEGQTYLFLHCTFIVISYSTADSLITINCNYRHFCLAKEFIQTCQIMSAETLYKSDSAQSEMYFFTFFCIQEILDCFMNRSHCFTTQEVLSELPIPFKRYEKKAETLNMPKCLCFNPLAHYISRKVAKSFYRRVVPNPASDYLKICTTYTLVCMQPGKKGAFLHTNALTRGMCNENLCVIFLISRKLQAPHTICP